MDYRINILLIGKDKMLKQTLHDLLEVDCHVFDTENAAGAREVIERIKIDMAFISIDENIEDNQNLIKWINNSKSSRNIAIGIVHGKTNPKEIRRAIHNGALYAFGLPLNPIYIRDIVNNVIRTFFDERVSLIEQYKDTKSHFESFLNASLAGYVTVEKRENYQITFLSKKTVEFLGYSNKEKNNVSLPLKLYVHPDEWDRLLSVLEAAESNFESRSSVFRLKKQDGSFVPMHVVIRKVSDYSGVIKFDFINYYIQDESDREKYLKKEIDEYKVRIMHDPLTGIFNRETFYEETTKLIREYPRYEFVLGVFNIDRFKSVNELFGTAVGDKLLKEFAECLRDNLSNIKATFGRLESDHFVVCMSLEDYDSKENWIDNLLEGRIEWNSLNYHIYMHIGMYRIEEKNPDITLCCDRANTGLQTIKESFVYRKRFFSKEMRDALVTEQRVMQNADVALINHEFYVVYQPIVDAKTRKITAAEALVRWHRLSDGSFISPGDFVPIFEKNGYISKIDMYMWETVCAFQAKRVRNNLPTVPVSVNLSRIDFYNPNLFDELTSVVEKYGISSELLKIEITESAYMDQPRELLDVIDKFKKYGFKILMDDFGSGYSSLNMLKDVNVDVLKIDMRFMDSLDTSDIASNILYSIIQMAKAINMEIVAEGVETENQYNLLLGMDCDNIQGYYFYKPIFENEFEKELSEHTKSDCKEIFNVKPRIMYLSKDKDDGFETAVKDEFEIYKLSDSDSAVAFLKRNAYSTGLCVVDFDTAFDEGKLFVEHMKQNTFYSSVPILATVPSDNAEEVAGEFVGNGIVDSIGKPYHPSILRQRIRNTIEYSEIMFEKRAVSVLQKNVQIRQQMNSFLEDSVAGVAKIVLDYDNVKIKEISYVNDKFLKLHELSMDEIYGITSLKKLLNNSDSFDFGRIYAGISMVIEAKERFYKSEYRVIVEGHIVNSLIVGGTFKYKGDEVLLELVVLEKINENEQQFNETLEMIGNKTGSLRSGSLWYYYPDENIIEYFRKNTDGKFDKNVVYDAVNYMASRAGNCEPARADVFDFFDRILTEGSISKNIHVYYNDAIENVDRWIRMTGQLVDNKITGRYVAGISELIDDEISLMRYKFRNDMFLSLISRESDFYLEFDLTKDVIVNDEFNSLRKYGITGNNSFDYILDCFSTTTEKNDMSKVKNIFDRRTLIERAKRGEKAVSCNFLATKPCETEYDWYTMTMLLEIDSKTGHVIGGFFVSDADRISFDSDQKLISERDSLTGFYNRSFFEKKIDVKLAARLDDDNEKSALIIVDVDDFRVVNDEFGHDLGDSVLRTLGKLISKCFDEKSYTSRLCGDEFGIFVYDLDDKAAFERKLNDFIGSCKMTMTNGMREITVSVSAGVVYSGEFGNNFHQLFPKADYAKEKSKTEGKNRYSVYSYEK